MKILLVAFGLILSSLASAETLRMEFLQGIEICAGSGGAGFCRELNLKNTTVAFDSDRGLTWHDVVESQGIPFKSKFEFAKMESGQYQINAWVMRDDTGADRVDLQTQVGALSELNALTLWGTRVQAQAGMTIRPVFTFAAVR